MKKAPRDLNCKCGALCNRHSSCLCCIFDSEAWGRCPSDYNLLQSCLSSSMFCLWWRREKRFREERRRAGGTMMDFWHTGWDRLREGGAAGFTFQRTVGFVSSCDPWSYQIFLSAAISHQITEMECQHEALYSRNRDKTGMLNLFNYTIHCRTLPLPFFSPPSQIWEQILAWYQLYHSICCLLIIHLRATTANSSWELYLAI